jgi:hypothetical protein
VREKVETVVVRLTLSGVVGWGLAAVLGLLGLAWWAYQTTQDFASCNPPGGVHVKVNQVYVCPTKYTHYWTVHTHADLVWRLLAGALVVAIVVVTVGVSLARRRPPVVGAVS